MTSLWKTNRVPASCYHFIPTPVLISFEAEQNAELSRDKCALPAAVHNSLPPRTAPHRHSCPAAPEPAAKHPPRAGQEGAGTPAAAGNTLQTFTSGSRVATHCQRTWEVHSCLPKVTLHAEQSQNRKYNPRAELQQMGRSNYTSYI